MKVFLLRHGEVSNPKSVLYGRLPGFYLSKKGKIHIKKTALKLKGDKVQKIYSSPLERAVETAKILISELSLKK